MSKYKCISDSNRQCIHIPNGVGCSKLCYDSYQQGRADALSECLNIVRANGYQVSLIMIKGLLEQLKEQKNDNTD